MLRIEPSERSAVPLLELAPDAELVGDGTTRVRRCTSRIEDVRPGDLFAAIVDAERDGHDDSVAAVARGAAAVLTERYLPVSGVPQLLADNSAAAYAAICQRLAGDPSQRLKVVGVTGTRGKTTTAVLIQAVLESGGLTCAAWNDEGVCDGENWRSPVRGGAEPAAAAELLRRGVQQGCSHAVMEFSSSDLARSRAAGLRLDMACITNVRTAHLDWHGTLRNYRLAKASLLRQTPDDGVAILNLDDPGSRGMLQRREGPTLTYSLEQEAEVTAQIVESSAVEQTFLITAGSDVVAARSRIAGRRHVENCLAAAAVGLVYGLDLATIARGLEAVEQLPGRFERLEFGRPYGVFLEEGRDVETAVESLDVLRRGGAGRVVCVLDCIDWTAGEAARIAHGADVVFCSRCPDTNQVQEALHAAGELRHGADAEEVAVRAMEFAEAGDQLLFLGGGCRPFREAPPSRGRRAAA